MSILQTPSGTPLQAPANHKNVLAILHSGMSLMAQESVGIWMNPLLLMPTAPNRPPALLPILFGCANKESMPALRSEKAILITYDIDPGLVAAYEAAVLEARMSRANLVSPAGRP